MRVFASLVTFGLTGCFHLTGQVVEQRQADSVRVESYQRQIPLPKQSAIALTAHVADGQLRISAIEEKWCRTEQVEIHENRDRLKESLPSYHWAVLTSGLLATAGGAATWAIGADLLPPTYSLSIDEPAVEAERDLGHVLVPIGITLTAIGAAILGSYTTDAVLLEESTRDLDKTHRAINRGSGPCARSVASELAIGLDPMVRGAGSRVTVTTDRQGKVLVPVLDSDLWKLPYGEPFLTLTCKSCRPTTITLPKTLSARLVLKRKRREEMVAWLSRHGDSDFADEVRSALEKLKVVAEKRDSKDPDEMLADARTAIRSNRYDFAREVLEECVESHPSYKPCRLLEFEFTNKRVKKLSRQARSFLRWRKPIKAVIWADKCLQYDATSSTCRSIKESASSRWSKTNMRGKFRIRELTMASGVAKVRGDFRAPGRYSAVFVAIRLLRGGKEICRDKTTFNQVKSGRSLAFTGECDVSDRVPDGVKVTIEGYRL